MTATAGYKTRIYNGDFHLSAKLSDIEPTVTTEMLDVTTFVETAHRFIPGMDSASFTCSGFVDATLQTDVAAWTDVQPFSYCPQGSAIGSPALMINALKSSYKAGSEVAGVNSFTIEGQSDAQVTYGVSLHDHGAETADGSGSSVNNGAASTAGGFAHLHVTAFSGLTNAIVTIEDSANGASGWAPI